jgi:hypothetical protein
MTMAPPRPLPTELLPKVVSPNGSSVNLQPVRFTCYPCGRQVAVEHARPPLPLEAPPGLAAAAERAWAAAAEDRSVARRL